MLLVARSESGARSRSFTLPGRPGFDPAQGARLRPDRRHPLRRGQRLHQEHARQRPGRGDLLAGPDARSGRGPALHRPADGDLRQRGRRQRRPAGAGRGRGGAAGGRVRRPAGVPAAAGPGGHVPRHCPEVERGDGGHRRRPRGRDARAGRCRCPKHLRDTHYRGAEAVRPRRRTTSTATITRAAWSIRSICRRSGGITSRPTAASRRCCGSGWRSGARKRLAATRRLCGAEPRPTLLVEPPRRG